MNTEEMDTPTKGQNDEFVVFAPDYLVRGFERSLWKMEASLNDFIIVAKQMKPIDR